VAAVFVVVVFVVLTFAFAVREVVEGLAQVVVLPERVVAQVVGFVDGVAESVAQRVVVLARVARVIDRVADVVAVRKGVLAVLGDVVERVAELLAQIVVPVLAGRGGKGRQPQERNESRDHK